MSKFVDFSELDMPGWKTQSLAQSHDWEHFKSSNKIAFPIKLMKSRISEHDSLLDVGCFAGHLYGNGWHKNYLGIDLYPQFIQNARSLYPEARFEVADFRNFELPHDIVWCSRVLIHMPDFIENVKKLRSLARKSLFLVVAVGEKDKVALHEDYYYREFSEAILDACGKHELIDNPGHKSYKTAIYSGTANERDHALRALSD